MIRAVYNASDGTYQGKEGIPSKRHWIGFLNHRSELEHLGVHVKWRDGTGRDYDTAKAFEYGLDGE